MEIISQDSLTNIRLPNLSNKNIRRVSISPQHLFRDLTENSILETSPAFLIPRTDNHCDKQTRSHVYVFIRWHHTESVSNLNMNHRAGFTVVGAVGQWGPL